MLFAPTDTYIHTYITHTQQTNTGWYGKSFILAYLSLAAMAIVSGFANGWRAYHRLGVRTLNTTPSTTTHKATTTKNSNGGRAGAYLLHTEGGVENDGKR